MIKSVQDLSSSGGVDLPFNRSESREDMNGEQANQREGKVDEESSNKRTRIVEVGPKKLELEKDLVDELRRDLSCQAASSLFRPMGRRCCRHPRTLDETDYDQRLPRSAAAATNHTSPNSFINPSPNSYTSQHLLLTNHKPSNQTRIYRAADTHRRTR